MDKMDRLGIARHKYPDRLHFGRDQFGNDLLKFLATLDLPQDVADKTYWQNAKKLLT